MSLATGTKIDSYEVLGTLGAGGMGEVYRARDPQLKRDVAIKVLPPFVVQDPDRLRRFEQEAQAAASLNHPNILAVYQFGSFQGSPYMVAELLEGATLRDQLERGPLSVRKAIDYGAQIAKGLAAAHEKGIVHRDLKPENLFVTRDGRIKILDFGLARVIHRSDDPAATIASSTDPGMVMGTVGYMAPEQVRGAAVDHRADIFAFGAILYEMLAGRRAFSKSTSAETMTAILNEDPPAISHFSGTTPPGVQRVVHRCLEKNPEQRFQSASDLAFALEALSDSGASSVIGLAAPEAQRSRGTLLWVGAVAILALLAVAYLVFARPSGDSVLRVVDYTQITHDGHTKYLEGTDGSRLYFDNGLAVRTIGQVAISGGEIAPVPVTVPNPALLDVSSDGSTLLVRSNVGGLTYAYPLWTVRTLGGSAHLLGQAENGAFSPDGSTVVYSTANSDLHLVRTDGTEDRNVAKANGFCMSFSWSPDGKSIRFTSVNFTSDNRNGNRNDNALWEMSSSGANLHRVLPKWTADQTEGRWAQDGSFFFVSGSQIWEIPAHHGLFASKDSHPLQITSGPIRWETPIPDRNGKVIYASGITRRGELVHLDPQSHHFEPFLGGISADSVSFSQDGKTVAYVSYPDGILWKANADGSGAMQLSDNTLYPRVVAMSPDGNQVLFEAPLPQGGYVRPWIVSAQGGAPRLLFPNDAGRDMTDTNWSPDSRKIVFAVSPEGGNDPKSEIRILDLATNQVTTVPGSTGMFSPHWSPDGRSISALPTASLGINIFDIATQRWSTPWHKLAGFETWSKDSQWIFFIEWQENPGIYRVRATGGDAERLVDLHGLRYTGYFGVWMGLDPNDNPMILHDIGTDDIYALTLGRK